MISPPPVNNMPLKDDTLYVFVDMASVVKELVWLSASTHFLTSFRICESKQTGIESRVYISSWVIFYLYFPTL